MDAAEKANKERQDSLYNNGEITEGDLQKTQKADKDAVEKTRQAGEDGANVGNTGMGGPASPGLSTPEAVVEAAKMLIPNNLPSPPPKP